MTTQELKALKGLIVATSLYYGRQLDDAVVLMQVQDLEDLPFLQVSEAFKSYRKDPGNKFAPLPAAIRCILTPKMSPEQLALESSSKIVEAMAMFGWTNPDKARAFMGEIAWDVVRRDGGWKSLCERTMNDELPILKAQWRELAKVVAIRQRQDNHSQKLIEEEKQKILMEFAANY